MLPGSLCWRRWRRERAMASVAMVWCAPNNIICNYVRDGWARWLRYFSNIMTMAMGKNWFFHRKTQCFHSSPNMIAKWLSTSASETQLTCVRFFISFFFCIFLGQKCFYSASSYRSGKKAIKIEDAKSFLMHFSFGELKFPIENEIRWAACALHMNFGECTKTRYCVAAWLCVCVFVCIVCVGWCELFQNEMVALSVGISFEL